jgi:hypothetical protein
MQRRGGLDHVRIAVQSDVVEPVSGGHRRKIPVGLRE